MNTTSSIPVLEGDAAAARDSNASHIQIIASAGSGKTETVSQRIARLVADGVEPESIVAFTFTTKAAAELKERVRERVEKTVGKAEADKLGNLYVGTIHGYCFDLLQKFIGVYESYQVIDENQLMAFAQRYASKLNLKQFDSNQRDGGRQFAGISRFLENLSVVENELLPLADLDADFASAIREFYELLDEHRLLSFGMQIDRAVKELQRDDIRADVSARVKHLIVDEYQDVNPAQERLIQLIAKPLGGANLVVVGDDDQAIYQWRGSSVQNITSFLERYESVKKFELLTNRRSVPSIVHLANRFAQTIPGRLEKQMVAIRDVNGPAVDIITDHETEADEAADIAMAIERLHTNGCEYREIAILVRTRTAYPAILKALKAKHIPITPGDRESLFATEDASFLGRVFAWFVDNDWVANKYDRTPELVSLARLAVLAEQSFPGSPWATVESFLQKTKDRVAIDDSRRVSLVEVAYDLVGLLGVKSWNLNDDELAARSGTVAKFIKFVADYEAMYKHSRLSREEANRQIGSADQGIWYWRNFAALMKHYALDKYRDFGGEDDIASDAVELLTVHAAKGLEWPIVFIPSLTSNRFPSSKTAPANKWIVPETMFDVERYEGTDADERRLFYVAATRAREWLSLSAHSKVTAKKTAASPFILEALAIQKSKHEVSDYPSAWEKKNSVDDSTLQITYSELADYISCGLSYRLRSRIGFPAAIVEEIGYGNAVHHLLRSLAEEATRTGKALTPRDVDRLMATDFFLPFAGKAVSDRFRESARKLVFGYLKDHGEDMNRVWQTERPFELALPGVIISGRADVILDKQDGIKDNLAIVDYKTSIGDQAFGLQLQVYAEAGLREGLEVRAAFIHDLQQGTRETVDTSDAARQAAVETVVQAVEGIKQQKFEAKPHPMKCGHCDVRAICLAAATPKVKAHPFAGIEHLPKL